MGSPPHTSQAIDELQRVAMLEPVARVRTQVDRLGSYVRKRLLLALLKEYGGDLIASQDESERVAVMRALLSSLDMSSRQSLVRTLARRADVVGESVSMASGLLQSMGSVEAETVRRLTQRIDAGTPHVVLTHALSISVH